MSNDKNYPISIRLRPEIAEEFRKLAQNEGVSQSKFIEILIENFTQGKKESNDIKIFLSKYNNFLKDENDKRVLSMVYEFKGKCLYLSDLRRNRTYSAKEYEDELREEFKIDEEINLEEYELESTLNAYKNEDTKKYIILEILGIRKKFMQTYDIYLNRCYEVENIKELSSKLHRYSNQQDILNIEASLAITIRDTKYFELFY